MLRTMDLLDAVRNDWLASHEHAAQRLSRGDFLAVAGDLLPDDTDVDRWTAQVAELCQAERTTVEFVADRESDITLLMNTAAMPTLDQIESAIAEINRHRRAS